MIELILKLIKGVKNMWLIIHLATAVILVVTVILGLTAQSQKRINEWMITSRCLYLILLVTGGVLMFFIYQSHPILSILKLILAIGLIAVIEIAFARKQERHVTTLITTLLSILFIATIICGFLL